jgi:hypothetical protein
VAELSIHLEQVPGTLVQPYRNAARIEQPGDLLGLAQRVGVEDRDRLAREGLLHEVAELIQHLEAIRKAKARISERALHHQHVGRHRDARLGGRRGLEPEVATVEHPRAAALHQHHRGSEDVSGREQRHGRALLGPRPVEGMDLEVHRAPALRTQRGRRGRSDPAPVAADVVGVRVRHDAALAPPAGIDEDLGSDPVDSVVEVEHEPRITEPVVHRRSSARSTIDPFSGHIGLDRMAD